MKVPKIIWIPFDMLLVKDISAQFVLRYIIEFQKK